MEAWSQFQTRPCDYQNFCFLFRSALQAAHAGSHSILHRSFDLLSMSQDLLRHLRFFCAPMSEPAKEISPSMGMIPTLYVSSCCICFFLSSCRIQIILVPLLLLCMQMVLWRRSCVNSLIVIHDNFSFWSYFQKLLHQFTGAVQNMNGWKCYNNR